MPLTGRPSTEPFVFADARGRSYTVASEGDVLRALRPDERAAWKRACRESDPAVVWAVRVAVVGGALGLAWLCVSVVWPVGVFAALPVGAWIVIGSVAPLLGVVVLRGQDRVDERRGRALARVNRCASCAVSLLATEPQADGCTVCPECGAAWRVGESTAGTGVAQDER